MSRVNWSPYPGLFCARRDSLRSAFSFLWAHKNGHGDVLIRVEFQQDHMILVASRGHELWAYWLDVLKTGPKVTWPKPGGAIVVWLSCFDAAVTSAEYNSNYVYLKLSEATDDTDRCLCVNWRELLPVNDFGGIAREWRQLSTDLRTGIRAVKGATLDREALRVLPAGPVTCFTVGARTVFSSGAWLYARSSEENPSCLPSFRRRWGL